MAETKSDLEARAIAAEERNRELEAKIALLQGTGAGGWLIEVPNQAYSGRTGNVDFRYGRAFISDRYPDAEKKAKELSDDFGYSYRHLTAEEMAEEHKVLVEEQAILSIERPGVIGG